MERNLKNDENLIIIFDFVAQQIFSTFKDKKNTSP